MFSIIAKYFRTAARGEPLQEPRLRQLGETELDLVIGGSSHSSSYTAVAQANASATGSTAITRTSTNATENQWDYGNVASITNISLFASAYAAGYGTGASANTYTDTSIHRQ